MTLHRRTFLNTAAVAAAAFLPGCMAMAPAAASIRKAAPYVPEYEVDPDAELNRLGQEFDGLHALYLVARRQSFALHAVAHAPLFKRVHNGERVSVGEMARAERESGFSAANEHTEALALELDKLTEAIRTLPAATPQGLYVKVRAASFDCGFSHVIDGQSPDEMDHDVECFFHLLEDAKRFAEICGQGSNGAVLS